MRSMVEGAGRERCRGPRTPPPLPLLVPGGLVACCRPKVGRSGVAAPFLIADMGLTPHRIFMREPFGTTQRGQVLLGLTGLALGVGGGLGLQFMPVVFEPILRTVLLGLSFVLRTHFYYDPSERTLFAIMLAIFGTVWTLLSAYAFAREPARNRAIDSYLSRKNEIDRAQRKAFDPEDDQPA